jgi:hypothetical protein
MRVDACRREPTSTLSVIAGGLPPASPYVNEATQARTNETRFLIGGYKQYKCPHVWMRSSSLSSRNKAFGGGRSMGGADEPLKLERTQDWETHQSSVWHIVHELVNLSNFPAPANPFALDWNVLGELPLLERTLAQGALIDFLRQLLLAAPSAAYAQFILSDMLKLMDAHYSDVATAAS